MNTEECECKITTKKQYGDIYALLLMDDKTFLSGSRNGEIKVWGY